MSNACTPILMGVVSPVSEIPQLSKTAIFPFQPMDFQPMSMLIKKFNRSESVQKIHVSRD